MAKSHGWRYVATLLLLFAAADVLVPGLCLAEAEQARLVSSWGAGASVASGEVDSQYEDCFCCCAHVIPELRQSASSHQSMVGDVAYVLAQRADLSPAPLYRPPRAL